jgi:hypothetical protein
VQVRWFFAMQQIQEMCGDGVFVRLYSYTFIVVTEVVPVNQNRAEAGNQTVA